MQYTLFSENDSELLTKVTTTYTTDVLRAFAKIAFNYLAYFNNREVALQSVFDSIRIFIKEGKWPEWQCILPTNQSILVDEHKKGLVREIHLIAIERINNAIVCRISLHNLQQIIVILTPDYTGLSIKTDLGHWFDPHSKTIGQISKSSLLLNHGGFILHPQKHPSLWMPQGSDTVSTIV